MSEVHQFKIRYTVTQWWLPPHCAPQDFIEVTLVLTARLSRPLSLVLTVEKPAHSLDKSTTAQLNNSVKMTKQNWQSYWYSDTYIGLSWSMYFIYIFWPITCPLGLLGHLENVEFSGPLVLMETFGFLGLLESVEALLILKHRILLWHLGLLELTLGPLRPLGPGSQGPIRNNTLHTLGTSEDQGPWYSNTLS